jgi:uroporphyrinogen-III synthase
MAAQPEFRMARRLEGARILILETREEAQFSRLLAEQGAEVMQCPMFTIQDAPDPEPVRAWIGRCVAASFDDLVLMTGEGLRRLRKLAQADGTEEALIGALGSCRIFARGPKPGRALREIGLAPYATTEIPTSEGMKQLLARHDLHGRRLGFQLYPEKDQQPLIAAIEGQGATVDPVLPYVYDRSATEGRILSAIDAMAEGRIDALAVTSSGQVRRLFQAAQDNGVERRLRDGLGRTKVASVGPVVAQELAAHGVSADVAPANETYFMKPLISAMSARMASGH